MLLVLLTSKSEGPAPARASLFSNIASLAQARLAALLTRTAGENVSDTFRILQRNHPGEECTSGYGRLSPCNVSMQRLRLCRLLLLFLGYYSASALPPVSST